MVGGATLGTLRKEAPPNAPMTPVPPGTFLASKPAAKKPRAQGKPAEGASAAREHKCTDEVRGPPPDWV